MTNKKLNLSIPGSNNEIIENDFVAILFPCQLNVQVITYCSQTGACLSYNEHKNIEENFFSKILKARTKLNIWQKRDLSLYGRSMLVKAVGVSQLIYAASMLTVPEPVIQKTQAELFAFFVEEQTR